MKNHTYIGQRKIGAKYPAFIVAELSCNHLNDYSIALRTINEAANSGADAIKLATLTPDTMTIYSNKDDFVIKTPGKWYGRTFYDLYTETAMPYEWHESLIEYANDCGIYCFSTPYDISSLNFLDSFDLPAIKISSFEIVDLNLVREVARRGKPVIISTGVATKNEIQEAVEVCKNEGNNDIILLKCTSAYPTPYDEVNLKALSILSQDFNLPVGISDHTLGNEVPIASVPFQCSFIEKHIILNRELGGPDSHFSLEPSEFKEMVTSVRNTELALGEETYQLTPSALNSRNFRRSLYVVKDISAGESFTQENISSIRPGFGLEPKYFYQILGKKAKVPIEKGTPLTNDKISYG